MAGRRHPRPADLNQPRYVFAATLVDPGRSVLVSEWETQESPDEHYNSESFPEFQFDLEGLLARPSLLTVYSAEESVRPLSSRPLPQACIRAYTRGPGVEAVDRTGGGWGGSTTRAPESARLARHALEGLGMGRRSTGFRV